MKSNLLRVTFLLTVVGVALLAFQNCSPVTFKATESSLSSLDAGKVPTDPTDPVKTVIKCVFNGQSYNQGERVTAFLASSGAECVSEERVCVDGAFTGSYAFASCSKNQPAACLFNGKTIASGDSVDAFQQSSVGFGKICNSEKRICTNGALSGSFAFAACSAGAANSCLFNGQTIVHGGVVRAFQTSSVSFGLNCSGEDRVCNNGTLSGSFSFGSCAVGAANSCLFNGQTIAHGGTVRAFKTSSVSFGLSCSGEDRICNNGALSGSFTFGSCAVGAAKSCLFNGQTIAHGQSVTAFASARVAYNQKCASESRQCNDGTLSGSFNSNFCVVDANPAPKCTVVGSSSVLPAFTRVGDRCAITSNFSFTFNCDRDIVGKPYGIRISNTRTYKDGTGDYRGSSYYHENYGLNPGLADSAFVLNNPRSLTISGNFLFRNRNIDEPFDSTYQCNYVQSYDMKLDFYIQKSPGDLPESFMGGGDWPTLILQAR